MARNTHAQRRIGVVALVVGAAFVIGALVKGGTASASPTCQPGEITLVSAPWLTTNPPTITSSGGQWTSCSLSFTGFYKEWLRNGVVIAGPTWVAGNPGPFTYTAQEGDIGQTITSAVQPCNDDRCYDSYVTSSNSVVPGLPDDYTADAGNGVEGSDEPISEDEARYGYLPGDGPELIEDSGSGGLSARTCWAKHVWRKQGRLAYFRKIIQHTNWCQRNGDHIVVYRRTNTTVEINSLCSSSNRQQYLVEGGVGHDYAEILSGAEFACDVPWGTYHQTMWFTGFYTWGSALFWRYGG